MQPKDKKSAKPAPSPPDRKAPETTYKGLCMNCDKRFTCSHCHRQGGVWFCEEYE